VHLDKSHNRSWSLVDVLYKLNNRSEVKLLVMYCQIYSRHDCRMFLLKQLVKAVSFGEGLIMKKVCCGWL
jgi:hypothetical protein